MNRLKRWLYKWLPIIMGCHCRPDRSFHWRGRPFPVCARCTGQLAGALAVPLALWAGHPPVPVLFALALPMVLDGVIQLKTSYESTNLRRFWTGFLFGYSVLTLFVLSHIATFRFGRSLGRQLKTGAP